MRPKQLILAIIVSIVLTLTVVIGYEFFDHPKPPDPFQPVNITSDAGYNEAEKEAAEFSNAVFPKIEQNLPLNGQDIDYLTKAIRLYDGMTEYKPGSPMPGMTAGEAFLALRKNDRAIEHFQQFLLQSQNVTDPRMKVAQSDAHYLISQAYFNLHDYKNSLAEIKIALSKYPNASAYLTQLASIELQTNQVKLAKADAERALKIDPNNSHAKGILSLLKGVS